MKSFALSVENNLLDKSPVVQPVGGIGHSCIFDRGKWFGFSRSAFVLILSVLLHVLEWISGYISVWFKFMFRSTGFVNLDVESKASKIFRVGHRNGETPYAWGYQ